MTTHNSAELFLQAVFGTDHGEKAMLANLNPPFHTRNLTALDASRDCYWSIAAFAAGARTNVLAEAAEVRAFVVDDVGTKVPAGRVLLALGQPTARVETSAGNEQWVYRLSPAVAVAGWKEFFEAQERLIGVPLEGRSAVHLMRLPMGVNTKPERNLFHVKLVELNAGTVLDVDKFSCGGCPNGGGTTAIPAGGLQGPSPEPRVADIGRLLGMVPNDDLPYDDWMAVLQRTKALAIEDAEEAIVAWSAKSSKFNEAETRQRWGTIRPDRTRGQLLLDTAQAADPAGFDAWWQAEAGEVFDDGEAEPPPEVPPRGAVKFRRGKDKQILALAENAELALRGLGIDCTYDEFHHRFYVRGEALSDHLVLRLRREMRAAFGKDFGPVHTIDAVMGLGLQHGFNPVTNMLAGAELTWDGGRRLDRLGPDYFHTDDTELARACFRKTMIAAVRRARQPGVKFDQILVTESPEGWDKSTAWAVLAGEGNFSDADILGKDAKAVQEELADVWIHEIADLSGLSKAEVEHVKAFASRVNDRARPAYGRILLNQPRQNILVGTTNADAYLLSPTGNRRFWTFKLHTRVDIAAVRRDRLALWGEAAAAESAGESLVLDAKLWGMAAAEQEKRRVIDTWEDDLGLLVEMPPGAIAPTGFERVTLRQGKQFISNNSVNAYLKDDRRHVIYPGAGRRISEIMRRLGWERVVVKVNGMATRGYERDRVTGFGVTAAKSVTENPF